MARPRPDIPQACDTLRTREFASRTPLYRDEGPRANSDTLGSTPPLGRKPKQLFGLARWKVRSSTVWRDVLITMYIRTGPPSSRGRRQPLSSSEYIHAGIRLGMPAKISQLQKRHDVDSRRKSVPFDTVLNSYLIVHADCFHVASTLPRPSSRRGQS